MIDFYDFEFWMAIFHIFTVALIIYAILHKIWEFSKTTFIVIVGFEVSGLLIQFSPIGVTVMFLILLMLYLYFRAVLKPKKFWSKYEVKRCGH